MPAVPQEREKTPASNDDRYWAATSKFWLERVVDRPMTRRELRDICRITHGKHPVGIMEQSIDWLSLKGLVVTITRDDGHRAFVAASHAMAALAIPPAPAEPSLLEVAKKAWEAPLPAKADAPGPRPVPRLPILPIRPPKPAPEEDDLEDDEDDNDDNPELDEGSEIDDDEPEPEPEPEPVVHQEKAMADELLTEQDAAEFLEVKKPTLAMMRRGDKIKHHKDDQGQIVYRKKELIAYRKKVGKSPEPEGPNEDPDDVKAEEDTAMDEPSPELAAKVVRLAGDRVKSNGAAATARLEASPIERIRKVLGIYDDGILNQEEAMTVIARLAGAGG